MADSNRSRSPAPVRNRTEPRGQAHAPRPELPFFPRWRGPMNSSILHFQNMPRTQSRPQGAKNQPGPYMMGRMMNPSQSMMQTNWSNHQFPPTPPPSIPPTLPYLPPSKPLHLAHRRCHVHQHKCALQAHLLSLRPSHGCMKHLLRPHQEALAITMLPELMGLTSTLTGKKTGITITMRQPEDQWIDNSPGQFVSQLSLKSWISKGVIFWLYRWRP